MNTGDSASLAMPPNRPDGLGLRALLEPALLALYAWAPKSRGQGLGVRDQEALEDFVGQEAASFRQANGIAGSLQQFLSFEICNDGLQRNERVFFAVVAQEGALQLLSRIVRR